MKWNGSGLSASSGSDGSDSRGSCLCCGSMDVYNGTLGLSIRSSRGICSGSSEAGTAMVAGAVVVLMMVVLMML